MKKIVWLIIVLLAFPLAIKADRIYNVEMDIYLNQDGVANIKETWDVKASGGSEWYKQVLNLGNSKLSNFKVTMDGKTLTYQDYWDTSGSLNEKALSYGINYISNGLELCFGKTDMKRHKFVLTYDISNYVFNTSDAQVLYWTLFPKFTADNFSVKLRSYYDFPDTLDVWGYGYKGYAYVKNGIIEMSNEGKLADEYVVLLAKFPLNTFNVINSYSNVSTFDDVLDLADKGSFDYNYGPSLFEKIINFLVVLFNMAIGLSVFLIPFFMYRNSKYGFKDNKVIKQEDVPMYRDIPCNKDIYYANALVKLNSFKKYKETNILGSIILKWVKHDKIKFINEKTGIFNKETSVIDLTFNNSDFDNEDEKRLFDMMYEASKDGKLEAKELEKWARSNYQKFLDLFDKISNDYIAKLKSEKHIYERTSKEECKYKNVMDDTLYEESKKIYGLEKFLTEFSSINTKEVIEVKLWDEYLMFAYLFGIADKVAKQLKNMYPEVIVNQDINYDTLIFINNISVRSVSAASTARSAAQSYSSGGGGFSSGGGGGGSFGGGGSMGGR